MRVAVLGSSGGMGSFFVRYFLSRGDTVSGSDLKPANPRPKGLTFHRSNSEAARGSDVTIIAAPMDKTLKVAREVAASLKRGSTLVEISSVKGETLPSLRKVADGRVRLLSVHPLFGPALDSSKGMKIALVGRKGEPTSEESALARRLFPEARIIPMSRKEHDRAMAVVLSLTHILNLVYAGTVAGLLSPEEFMRISTPNSSMQLTLAEAVLAQDPRLLYAIQAGNPYSRRVARAAARELKRVLAMIEASDWESFEEYHAKLSKVYKSDKRAAATIREIYSAAENAG